MVLVYHLVGSRGERSAKTEAFLKDLENMKYRGAITTFTKTEYLGVAKKLISERMGRELKQVEQDLVGKGLDSFVQKMGLEVYDADLLVKKQDEITLFEDCGHMIRDSRPIKGSKGKWLMVGAADSIVIKLAEYAEGDYLATFDEGLRGIVANLRPLDLRRCY